MDDWEREEQDFSVVVHFNKLEDPRIDRTKKYPLLEIVFLVIVGVLCGANSWAHVVLVGGEKLSWLRKFFPYKNGIPSHDTIGRVFSLIDPKQFHECFLSWVQGIAKVSEGEIIAIDGKQSRNSHSQTSEALYLVSAWAERNSLVLGQVSVADKSNEITAIPRLLDIIDTKGAVVTIDAVGCQKEIAQKIVDKKSDYVLALKANQKGLFDAVNHFFDSHFVSLTSDPRHHVQTVEKGHGRIETRQCVHIEVSQLSPEWCASIPTDGWKGLKSLILIDSRREIKDHVSDERRLYISTLPLNPERAAAAVRSHWQVENQLHWTLDVVFSDDHSRVRKDHAPKNFAVIKKWALGMLKKIPIKGASLSGKRLLAMGNNDFLERLICQMN